MRVDEGELRELYEQLRSVAGELGLAWVLDELDEATTIGVTEIRSLRQQTRQGRVTYEELSAAERTGAGRVRAEEFISRRSMTQLEQVDALLDAMMRILVDLDEVAAASVAQLNDLPLTTPSRDESPFADSEAPPSFRSEPDAARTRITEIDFAPDEGSLYPPVSSELIRGDTSRRDEVARVLRDLRVAAHQ